MFVFVDGLGHPFEMASGVEFRGRIAVDGEVAEGCFVVRASGQGGLGEIVVMRRAEEEDPLTVLIL